MWIIEKFKLNNIEEKYDITIKFKNGNAKYYKLNYKTRVEKLMKDFYNINIKRIVLNYDNGITIFDKDYISYIDFIECK